MKAGRTTLIPLRFDQAIAGTAIKCHNSRTDPFPTDLIVDLASGHLTDFSDEDAFQAAGLFTEAQLANPTLKQAMQIGTLYQYASDVDAGWTALDALNEAGNQVSDAWPIPSQPESAPGNASAPG